MRVINTALNLILLAGTTLLLIFLVLSGSTNHFPFNRFYWVRGDTSNIPGAPDESAWTFWGVCDYHDFGNCTSGPAYPISPVDNFHTKTNVPQKFRSNRDPLFYLSRFSFAFILIALALTALAFIIDLLGFCFIFIDKIVIGLVMFGLFFMSGAAAFQTAATVMAKNAFSNGHLKSHIGVKSMAILWAAEACMLIIFFNTCAANIANSYRKHIERVKAAQTPQEDYYAPAETQQKDGLPIADESSFTRSTPLEKEDNPSGGIRFFRIKRNQKPSDEESV
ncbi:hypothetical protein A9F13_01g02178 [Clavispora lusitaniae]|uniref:SUR7 family protein n=1 Tax=Clavispora lusitaniae TaxID=36911 RepID=A0AA91Q4W4_CLALS|nr:hypothetical protein A9F13_01g02178 [Clavispora lusitaniae]